MIENPKIINGKELAESIRSNIKQDVATFASTYEIVPKLVVLLIGENEASLVYVANKERACHDVGIESQAIRLPVTVTQDQLVEAIGKLNEDISVHGILVQLPLPKHINEDIVLEAINPKKDVDGFHPYNVGRLVSGKPVLVPCTPAGIMEILKSIDCKLAGKQVVVIGRSNIVGKPVAQLCLQQDATVTLCHSRTQNLETITTQADVLISAAGKPGLVTAAHIKTGAVVIDVGTTKIDGRLNGDVCFDQVLEKCGRITPVPKGVGPMTIAYLLKNTLIAAKHQLEVE